MSANETQVGGSHYKDKAVQPWAAMQAWMTHEEFTGFLRGNVIKYVARCNDKGGIEDLKKARHYLDKLIETLEPQSPSCVSSTVMQEIAKAVEQHCGLKTSIDGNMIAVQSPTYQTNVPVSPFDAIYEECLNHGLMVSFVGTIQREWESFCLQYEIIAE